MRKIGNYKLEGLVGQGGNGIVYRSMHPVLGRPVAIKALHQKISADPELRARFLREARVTIELNHPGIVNVYDVNQDGEHLFIVMELFEHGSLADQLSRQRLPLARVLDVAAEIADALDFAHCRGVVHRDIKPSNVLLRGDGSPVLADFGLATAPSTASTAVAPGGEALGTPSYMAPEQIRGGEIDERTDVYAFGAVLYEMVAGRPPFDGPVNLLIHKHLTAVPAALRDQHPSIPAELEALVTQLLAKQPARRPADLSKVAASLRAMRSELPQGAAAALPLRATPNVVARPSRITDGAATIPVRVEAEQPE